LFEEIATETNRYIIKKLKKTVHHEPAVSRTPNFFSPEFRKKVIEVLVGNIKNEMTRKRGRPSWTDVEDRLNGKLHLIQAHDGKLTKDCAVCSNRKWKETEEKYRFIVTRVQGSQNSTTCASSIYHIVKKYLLECSL
jgi:hypothetical protein